MTTAPDIDFAAAYAEFQPKILNYVYRRTSDPFLSEDLTANVFLKAIDSIDRGAQVENVSGWLHRIAHNLVIDEYRSRDRHGVADLDEALPDKARTPLDWALHNIDAATLKNAMARLTDEQAEAIELRYFDGCEFGEIAAIMGKTEGAVKALMVRAYDSLYARLQKAMGYVGPREVREVNCADALCALLRERGPMTVAEIMAALRVTKNQASYALYTFVDKFTVVGKRPGRRGPASVWAIREAA